MRKPNTNFKWVDQAGATTATPVLEVRPLFLTASSFDKGPEDVIRVYGDDFYKLFGQHISFARHGQAAIQAANIIDAGGELLIKRVVAKDAKLAHLIITATVQQETVQKKDSANKPLYLDAAGKETTVAGDGTVVNKPITFNRAVIKFGTDYVASGVQKMDEIVTYSETLYSETVNSVEAVEVGVVLTNGATAPLYGDLILSTNAGIGGAEVGGAEVGDDELAKQSLPVGTIVKDASGKIFEIVADKENNGAQIVNEVPAETVIYTYPLFIITDNGRGASDKKFNITCHNALSKNIGFAMYELNHLGIKNFDAEAIRFSIDTDKIYANTSYSLEMSAMDAKQLKAKELSEYTEAFLEKLAEMTGIELDILLSHDILNGCDVKKNPLPQIHIYGTAAGEEEKAVLLSNSFKLEAGSNGNFGVKPVDTDPWEAELKEFFNGTFDDVIYDRDRHKIEVCLDANYPKSVKDAIATLANYREDFMFFRDYGLNNNSWDRIQFECDTVDMDSVDTTKLVSEDNTYKTKFNKEYCTSYDVIDKFTRKQIPVTIMYSIGRLLVNHLNNNRTAPFAGVLYNVTIPEAIEGTVNFIPKQTPEVDQKDQLVQNHINYATYVNGVLTIETDMTAQAKETCCSYGNNILTVQETIRKVRTLCPKLRGSFIESSDALDKYAQKVKDVIAQDKDNYKSIDFAYTADEIMKANNVFDASLYCEFKNYVGSEEFTIYTLNQ